ncbi:MAG: ATP-binding cassette domain-containing protein [Cytophagales bacterium]|nr:ATP-binding cassette domain-containing protein [Cytophagales bacterium]
MLQVNKLLKKYGDKTILEIENLHIDRGISHLKGINGSGKTTFSKIIAGLIPFEGEVTLLKKFSPVKSGVAYRKQVNYSESEANYPDFLSANDLISFIGKAKGATKNDQTSIAETFGVNEYLFDHIGTYSSGMLKRLSLTLAFLGTPSLVLLDEPFNTLDASAIEILKFMIVKHCDDGVNFILVSHQDIGKLGIRIDGRYMANNLTIARE